MNLVLIGYRGTGKTSVARCLARRLSWESFDADVEVESRAGKSIAAIFADEGEAAFRGLESVVIANLSQRDNIVLAAGGGAVLSKENRDALRGAGKVVWLRASPQTIEKRIAADFETAARRPNLTKSGGIGEIELLLAKRTPFYCECADLEVDTEGKSPAQVAEEILTRLQLVPSSSEPA